ncbi:MAG: VOC family protein [Gemmatimonadaceae bacterium]
MQKITPFLWFDGNAEDAINLYVSVFKNSKIGNMSRYAEGGLGPAGTVMTASFTLEGQDFMALNGGPMFKFTPAISLFVSCETQAEVDELYSRLAADGSEEACGWLKDKFGLSWQIIPTALPRLMQSREPGKAARVMQAMMKMKKIDIKGLEDA